MFADRTIDLRKYWDLDFSADDDRRTSEDEHARELMDLLVDATRIRLRADVPVGAQDRRHAGARAPLLVPAQNAGDCRTRGGDRIPDHPHDLGNPAADGSVEILAPSLRYITSAAAALPVMHIRQLRAYFPDVKIFSMYGLTECRRVSYLPPDQLDVRPTSVGRAIP